MALLSRWPKKFRFAVMISIPVFKWLVDQSKELAKNVPSDNSKDIVWKKFLQDPVIWNFTKFLIDENGNLIAVFHNKVSPMSEEVLKYLN